MIFLYFWSNKCRLGELRRLDWTTEYEHILYVTLDHKTSHKGHIFEIEIYTL